VARFALNRVLHALPTLLLTSLGIFVLLRVIPGDAATAVAGPDATPETIAAIRADLGLDQPIPLQYVRWLQHVSTGDLGRSTLARRPVSDLLLLALPATLELAAAAMLIAIIVGLSLGAVAAMSRGQWADLSIGGASALLIGVPSFWLGLLAIIVFALVLGWVPPGGRVDPLQDAGQAARSLLLPSLVLGLGRAAVIARFTRASMLEVLSEGYILTARSKGLSPRSVVSRHALRNALIPVVTMVGVEAGHLLGGALVIETVFAWPGLGRLVVGAISGRDYDVVQAVLLLMVGTFVLVNLIGDLLYGVLDPRLRATNRDVA
jgi:peptide/nickel transport system permease protein